jgi:hypothetical protein
VPAIGVGATDPTQSDIQGKYSFISGPALNVSSSGIGLGNNNLDGDTTAGITVGGSDESFVINPQTLLSAMKVYIDNSVGGYTPSTGEQLYFRRFYDDGTYDSSQQYVDASMLKSEAGGKQSFMIQTIAGRVIDAVQLTMGYGTVKIPNVDLYTIKPLGGIDVLLNFSATLKDKDGDTATSTFATTLASPKLSGAYQYVLNGSATQQDTFNINLPGTENTYQVNGWNAGDKLALQGAASVGVTAQNVAVSASGSDAVVSVQESGQVTTVTVVGAAGHVANSDILLG